MGQREQAMVGTFVAAYKPGGLVGRHNKETARGNVDRTWGWLRIGAEGEKAHNCN